MLSYRSDPAGDRRRSIQPKVPMQEQRKHQRYTLLLPAEVYTDDTSFAVEVIEISPEGLRLQSQQLLTPDNLVSVTVIFGRRIIFSGWVVWVLDKYLAQGHVYQSGIRIESITDDNAGIIGDDQRGRLIEEITGGKTTAGGPDA